MEKQMCQGGRIEAGFTLVEAAVGTAIAGIALGTAFTLSLQAVRCVDATRDATAATLSIQERLEQLRAASWTNILKVDYLTNTFLAQPLASAAAIQPLDEEIRVWSYEYASGETLGEEIESGETQPTTTPLIHLVKTSSGVRVIASSEDLPSTGLLRVDLAVSWRDAGGRAHTRESSSILALGGVLRASLGNETATGDDTTGETGDDTTGETGDDTDGTTDTEVEDGPGNSENAPGQSRGNVAGNNGKK